MILNRRGVTLIELTVATTIIALFIVLTMTFLVDKYAENVTSNARSELQHQTMLTLDLLNRDLKYAANVDSLNRWPDSHSPTSPSSDFGWQSTNNTLVLSIPAQDHDRNVLYEDPNAYVSYKDNYIYFVADATLYRRTLAADITNNRATTTCPAGTVGCSTDSKLATNISEFQIRYFDANDNEVTPPDARSISITLTVNRLLYGRSVNISETIRTVMRND